MTIPMLSPSNKVSPSAFGLAVGGHRTGPLRRDNEGACAGPQHTPQGKPTERQAEIPSERNDREPEGNTGNYRKPAPRRSSE